MQQHWALVGALLSGVVLGAVPFHKDKDLSTVTSIEQASSISVIKNHPTASATSLGFPDDKDKDKDKDEDRDTDVYEIKNPSTVVDLRSKDPLKDYESSSLSSILTSTEMYTSKHDSKLEYPGAAETDSPVKEISTSAFHPMADSTQPAVPSSMKSSELDSDQGGLSSPTTTASSTQKSYSPTEGKITTLGRPTESGKIAGSGGLSQLPSTKSLDSSVVSFSSFDKGGSGGETFFGAKTESTSSISSQEGALTSTLTLNQQDSLTLSLEILKSSTVSSISSEPHSYGPQATVTVALKSESGTSLTTDSKVKSTKPQTYSSKPEKGFDDDYVPSKGFSIRKPELTVLSTAPIPTFPGYVVVVSPPANPSSAEDQSSGGPTPGDKTRVQNATSTSIIPVWTPAMLGNAYGGGFIITPSIYVTIASYSSLAEEGVPPAYGSLETTIVPIGNQSSGAVLPPALPGTIPSKDFGQPSTSRTESTQQSTGVSPSTGVKPTAKDKAEPSQSSKVAPQPIIAQLSSIKLGNKSLPTPSPQVGTNSRSLTPLSDQNQGLATVSTIKEPATGPVVPAKPSSFLTGATGVAYFTDGTSNTFSSLGVPLASEQPGSTLQMAVSGPVETPESAQSGLSFTDKDIAGLENLSSPTANTPDSLTSMGADRSQPNLRSSNPSTTESTPMAFTNAATTNVGSSLLASAAQDSIDINSDVGKDKGSSNGTPQTRASAVLVGATGGSGGAESMNLANVLASGASTVGNGFVSPVMTAAEVSSIPSDLANFLEGLGISASGVATPKSSPASEEASIISSGPGAVEPISAETSNQDTKQPASNSDKTDDKQTGSTDNDQVVSSITTNLPGQYANASNTAAQGYPSGLGKANTGEEDNGTSIGPSDTADSQSPASEIHGITRQDTGPSSFNIASTNAASILSPESAEQTSSSAAIGLTPNTQNLLPTLPPNSLDSAVTSMSLRKGTVDSGTSSGQALPSGTGSQCSLNVSLPLGPIPYVFEGSGTLVTVSISAWLIIFVFAYLFL